MNLFICFTYNLVKNLALKSSTNGYDHHKKLFLLSELYIYFYFLLYIDVNVMRHLLFKQGIILLEFLWLVFLT